jgi:hypothetical protein
MRPEGEIIVCLKRQPTVKGGVAQVNVAMSRFHDHTEECHRGSE